MLTRVGDKAIDNEGMIDFAPDLRLPVHRPDPPPRRERVGPGEADPRRQADGRRLPVTRKDERLIKPYRGQYPRYFVHGPLVFSPVIQQASTTTCRARPGPGHPDIKRDDDLGRSPARSWSSSPPRSGPPDRRGYNDPFGQVVKDVDGVQVKNLRHLVELIRDGKGDYLTIRFHSEFDRDPGLPPQGDRGGDRRPDVRERHPPPRDARGDGRLGRPLGPVALTSIMRLEMSWPIDTPGAGSPPFDLR